MVKKKIDNRIRVMIENGVKMKHRTMFVVVGDKARDQVGSFSARDFHACCEFSTSLFDFRCRFCMTC